MPNSDASGYKIFWGWVGGKTCFSFILGKYRNKINRPKFQEKVPGYSSIGRSGRHIPRRPFQRFSVGYEEFREKELKEKVIGFQQKNLPYDIPNGNSSRCYAERLAQTIFVQYVENAPLV